MAQTSATPGPEAPKPQFEKGEYAELVTVPGELIKRVYSQYYDPVQWVWFYSADTYTQPIKEKDLKKVFPQPANPKFRIGQKVMFKGKQYTIDGQEYKLWQGDAPYPTWQYHLHPVSQRDQEMYVAEPVLETLRTQIGGKVNYYHKYMKYKQAYLKLKYGR
jgi:hypothetical protein